jgi:3-oxoacyl-[acyl-carrier protein] reductase
MVDKNRFQGRVSLITGGGSETGIGFATARIMGRSGAIVVLTSTTDRILRRAEALRAEGIQAKGYIADLSLRGQVAQLAAAVVSDFGRVDILINNAGMVQSGRDAHFDNFVDTKPEEWDLAINRNLTTCFNIVHQVLPHMIERNYGRIVNVSSVTGPLVSNPGSSGYGAAKAAMVGMSRALAIETGRNNVTINNVAPGWIATGSQTKKEAEAGKHTPLGRSGTPEEVGHLIAFLVSDESSYITGQMFVIDGGNTIQEYKGPKELYY